MIDTKNSLALHTSPDLEKPIPITDHMGKYTYTHQEWKELKHAIDRFYNNTAPEAIENHNIDVFGPPYVPPKIFEITCTEGINMHKILDKPFGYVYFAEVEQKGGMKIGYTQRSIFTRMRELSKLYRSNVFCAAIFETDDPVGLEASFHRQYSSISLGNEFFKLETKNVIYAKFMSELTNK